MRRLAVLCVLAACGGNEAPPPTGGGGPTGPTQPIVYVPGTSYFGDNDYVEYIAGNMPLIFTAPHGGSITPASIPARTASACGGEATTTADANTEDLARLVKTEFFNRTGKYPHIIINRLHRSRLDANREIGEAACGNSQAHAGWHDYHEFIEIAKSKVTADHQRGWYTDLHGHGHAIARLELGYDLSAATLRLSDAELDAAITYELNSSIRTFSQQSPSSFSALLRGQSSLGALLANAGYPSVPSADDPFPDVGEEYFSGGYSTERHSCKTTGVICGVQIEANLAGVRDTPENRAAFAAAIATAYAAFLTPLGFAF
jgi:hypothetical protein